MSFCIDMVVQRVCLLAPFIISCSILKISKCMPVAAFKVQSHLRQCCWQYCSRLVLFSKQKKIFKIINKIDWNNIALNVAFLSSCQNEPFWWDFIWVELFHLSLSLETVVQFYKFFILLYSITQICCLRKCWHWGFFARFYCKRTTTFNIFWNN